VSAVAKSFGDVVPAPWRSLVRADAARPAKATWEKELASLGIEEMAAQPDALVLVEWGERFESIASRADAEIAMEHGEEDERAMLVRWR